MADRSQAREVKSDGSGTAAKLNERAQPSNIVSPPGSKTPPSMPSKRTILFPANQPNQQRPLEGSEPVDAGALSRALKDYDEAGRRRERTPGTSPCRKRQRVYGDRYVMVSAGSQGSETNRTPDSFLTVMGKTCRQPSACCMRMAALQPPPKQRDGPPTRSSISKRVCVYWLFSLVFWLTDPIYSGGSKSDLFSSFAQRIVWQYCPTAGPELNFTRSAPRLQQWHQ